MSTSNKILNYLIIIISPVFLFAQFPNVQVSNPASLNPEEVTIAINPTNPLNLAAGANISYYYYSFDGGLNWTEGNLTSTLGVWGDPCVIFDGNGNLYFSHLSNPQNGNWIDRIVVQKSTDGGISWNDGVGIGLNFPKVEDKEWLAVDLTNSPYYNNIYMCWTEFDDYGSTLPSDSSRILFSFSSDSGETWATPLKISDVGGDCIDDDNTVEGAVPAVGPNGEIYTSWAGPLGIMFDRSLDGGLTFGTDIFVTDQAEGWALDVSGIYRCNGFPVTACDISSSPYQGNIYIMWSDQRNGLDNTDIFLKKSTDDGDTWSNIVKVNSDNTNRHQFFHWMTIDQSNGYIYAVFYDRRNTAGDANDVYLARSTDGGDTFSNFKISEFPFTPSPWVFFGDYIHIAAINGKIYPIWTRMDGTDLSVWTAIVNDSIMTYIGEDKKIPVQFYLAQNYPNPFNGRTIIEYNLPTATFVELSVFDLKGQKIKTLINHEMNSGSHAVYWDGTNNNGNSVSSGLYMYSLITQDIISTKKLLYLK